MSYYKEFINAVKQTETWGLNPGDIILDKSKKYLNENSASELLEMLECNYYGLEESAMLDCTNVSANMLELVENKFNTDAYLTTGNLLHGNVMSYECTLDYLKNMLSEGQKPGRKLKVHMWITLSSGEIIDFTFFRNMAINFSSYEPYKNLIVTEPILNVYKLTYIPMIVGDDFYRKTGNLVNVRIAD